MSKYEKMIEEIQRIIDEVPLDYECEHKDVVYMPLNNHVRCPRCGDIWLYRGSEGTKI